MLRSAPLNYIGRYHEMLYLEYINVIGEFGSHKLFGSFQTKRGGYISKNNSSKIL